MTSPSEPPRRAHRHDLAKETKSLIPSIMGPIEMSRYSVKYPNLLSPLWLVPGVSKPKITVHNLDSFTAAKNILDANPLAKVAVHNMASERHAGGGWLKGALAQEEALCLRSTLSATLHRHYYPLSTFAAIWSPKVAVFRDEVDSWCRIYQPDDIFIVGVVSLAALRRPQLSSEKDQFNHPGDILVVKDKIRQVLRIMGRFRITHCVLGAMGCGAFHNPPKEVARIYKEVLNEPEWHGYFEEISFAVLDSKREGNFRIFKDALQSDEWFAGS
ncbi:hypothetical protein N7478_012497 [Penicillium angulare]|uniref:uncharacterized protein n=1 Tax=Penicillium angulare TaxID=116970 RepID=UPI00254015DC|nr:uncharacterized protein N7478_012497 [Penicillium angulare]KAJ5259516.1 hypothetical protein N7478_012497 [Penicillium angulare]